MVHGLCALQNAGLGQVVLKWRVPRTFQYFVEWFGFDERFCHFSDTADSCETKRGSQRTNPAALERKTVQTSSGMFMWNLRIGGWGNRVQQHVPTKLVLEIQIGKQKTTPRKFSESRELTYAFLNYLFYFFCFLFV
eukprot:c20729_g1_i2.p1 GENE.c20729_g1_i2~~c20729_g1_i2.p1  ORF type:complete len:136 (-),score=23.76 c20729_g1_i2:439-846(-)